MFEYLALTLPERPDAIIKSVRAALTLQDEQVPVDELKQAIARWPDDMRLRDLHSSALEQKERYAEAAQVLLAAVDVPAFSSAKLRRAFSLARRSTNEPLVAEVCRSALARYPAETWALEALVRSIERSGNNEEMSELTVSLTSDQRRMPLVAFQHFRTAVLLGRPDIAQSREEALAAFSASERSDVWTGRLLRIEHDGAGAFAAFAQAVKADPEDDVALRELVATVFVRGRVGQYAGAILRAEQKGIGQFAEETERLRDFFTATGGSLEDAAAGVAPFCSMTSPGTPVEWLCSNVHRADTEGRKGILMIGGSLAAGGAERIVATLFSAFRQRRGKDAVNLCLFDMVEGEASSFYLPETNVAASDILLASTTVVSHPQIGWLPKPMARRTQALYDHIVALRPAVIHATLDMANVCAAYAALLAGVPRIVLHVHNMRPSDLSFFDEFHPDFDRCYRALLARPEISLVSVAEASVTDYLDWASVDCAAQTHVVHNGFDFSAFDNPAASEQRSALRASLGLTATDRLVGTAIRFTELKRPGWWIEMAEQLLGEFDDVHFVMFGDGDLRAEMQALVAERDLTHRVHLPGRVNNLHELIGALDLFALSSRTEGLPNVLIEAQAAGVPVVSYDVGGVRDTFDDGATGLLVREQSPQALAAAVRTLLADPDRLNSMKAAAPVFVRERFGIEPMVDKLLRILDGAAPPSADKPSRQKTMGWIRTVSDRLKRKIS